MVNLTTSRNGFKYDKILSVDGAKSKVIRFEVFYLKTFAGKKGVFVSITPKEVEKCEGYSMETVLLYNRANVSVFVKQLTRKSDKEVLLLAEKLDAQVLSIIEAYETDAEAGREAIRAAVQ